MANPTNAPSIDALVHHTISTLPDSVAARRRLLLGLLAVLPRTYPNIIEVNKVLVTLDVHDTAQRQLALLFNPEVANG